MRHLSALLNQHAALVQGGAVLLDYPVHGNVGDLLIWKGEQVFLQRNEKILSAQYSIKNMGRGATRKIAQCDTICLHGGGNFGDLWPVHQRFREDIIARYPNKRIIIFPQSVYYADTQELDRACCALKRHPDLHILLRDELSLHLLQDRGLANLRLCPDMAHALWGRWRPGSPTADRDERLYLLRRDKERGDLPKWLAGLEAQSKDWADLLEGRAHTWFRNGTKIVSMDKKYGNTLPACASWNLVADVLIGRAMKLLAAHSNIVTNRLHAVISSALIGRHVVAYDNSYGKVSAYVNCWLSGLDDIELRKCG
jgi:pyruvyl transferase EpsO